MTNLQKLTLAALAAICLIAVLPESGVAGYLEYKRNGKVSLDVRYERSYFTFNASDQIKANGWMNGVGATFTKKLYGRYVFRPEVRYAQGSVDYDGPLTYLGEHVSSSGKREKNEVIALDGRILFGYEFRTEKSSFTPYTGLCVRWLHIDINRIVSDSAGHSDKLDYNYLDGYLPFGIKYLSNRKDWDKGWSFAATAESDISFVYVGAYGVNASVELQKRFKTVNVAIEPFIRYWRHKKLEQTAEHTTKGPPQYSDETVGNYKHKIAVITDPPANVTESGIALKLRF